MKWEYLVFYDMWDDGNLSPSDYMVCLDGFGEKGWELIAVSNGVVYMKRLKEDIEVVETVIDNDTYIKEFMEGLYGKEEAVKEAHSEEDTHQPQRCSTAGQLYSRAYEGRSD